jgi:hypothetical protein
MSSVVVAGAGQRGLICAAQLAANSTDVVVVERLPYPGGQEPERSTARLAKAARQAGARFVLGTLAVQYDGTVVDVLGVDGAAALPCDALVVATGSRPATRAELSITGDRCAGVIPGSAALHLTQAGVLLGHRPLIAGSGAFAAHCAHMQLAAGASEVTMTLPAHSLDEVKVPAGVQVFAGYRVASVHGAFRIEAAVLRLESEPSGGAGQPPDPDSQSPRTDGEPQQIAADALILAAGIRPMRNIEGAIIERDGVFFCQPGGEDRSEQSARIAAAATCSLVLATLAASQASIRSAGTI